MWKLEVPWYDPAIRGSAMYIFIFILVRLMGKRQLAKLTSFDLVLLITISVAIQNGLTGEDHSITAYVISVSVIITLNILLSQIIASSPILEKLIDGQPVVIILNGKIFKRVMRQQKITESELFEALREHEVMNPEEVKCAILEKDGQISVIKYAH
jgi:uncharacterized membrane protein YcaP (DUF421 family)